VHAKKECGGVQIYLTDWSRFESIPTGYAIATALQKLHPKDWQTKRYNVLLGHAATFEGVQKGMTRQALLRLAEPGLKDFLAARKRYLLY
jgi:uncharacterized protein YbbC (DUF1343 family)